MGDRSEAQQPALVWAAMGLLGTLVATNTVFLALMPSRGPLIGLVLYAALLWRWRQRDYGAAVIGGIVGLAVHVLEVVIVGWSAYPVLMALNLILPAVLAPVASLAMRRTEQEGK
jgi:hypothetical protein